MTAPRTAPPGCCPGCLMSHETEPCALHRAGAEMLAALKALVAGHDEDPPMLTSEEWDAARAAIVRAEGGAR